MTRKVLIIIICILIGVSIGLLIVSQETAIKADEQIEETDRFIEDHEQRKEFETTKHIEETTQKNEPAENSEQLKLDNYSTEINNDFVELTPEEFREAGVIEWNGWKFTWYSENVLAGEGLNIPDRWSDGDFVRDGNGYLCVACNDLEKGTVVDTPLGQAIVYDAVGYDENGDLVHGLIDIYVSW